MCFLADVVRRRPLISSPGSVPRPGNGKSWGWAGSGTSSPGTGAAVLLSWHRPGTQTAHSCPQPVICASPALLCLTNAPGQQQRAKSSGWCCRARGRRCNLGFCSFLEKNQEDTELCALGSCFRFVPGRGGILDVCDPGELCSALLPQGLH